MSEEKYFVGGSCERSPKNKLLMSDCYLSHSHDTKIAFYPASDTIAYSFIPTIRYLDRLHSNISSIEIWLPKENTEGSVNVVESELRDIPTHKFKFSRLFSFRPDIVVVGSDWAPDAKSLIGWCRLLGIPTVCIQESVIDFNQHDQRMRFSDHVLIQGKQTLNHLQRHRYFVTGNPRYEILTARERASFSKVLVNVNFTYGIHEDIREIWLGDVIDVCNNQKLEIKISQHPRDRSDLSLHEEMLKKSNAQSIHSQLEAADILVTRFSSLIHEAIALGLKVIYYNPHDEKPIYDFQFDGKVIFLVRNPKELKAALEVITTNTSLFKERDEYSRNHFRPFQQKPSELIANWLLARHDKSFKDALFVGLKYLLVRPLAVEVLKFLGIQNRST